MAPPAFVDHCLELLAPLGAVRARRMFGGWGLYVDDLFIALIAADRLYLKTDAAAREVFAASGSEPFRYDSGGRQLATGYWSAPPDALDSPALMAPWARLSLRAALAARAARAVRPRRAAAAPAAARSSSRAATKRRG